MNEKNLQFIRGMGSLMNIAPLSKYDSEKAFSKQSVEQRVQAAWYRVTVAFEKTFNEIDYSENKPLTENEH